MSAKIQSIIDLCQSARLIPTVADSKLEERATASLLATFTIVPGFAHEVLLDAGASVTQRTKVECYTEVSIKTSDGKLPRPDGLIVLRKGASIWSAFVESKIGSAQHRKEQIEEYLDLAKSLGVDAVITISNQFATLPTHHPIEVSKQKLRSVDLYHFSWLSLVGKALALCEGKRVEDPEQAYILSELIRYLQHDASGVSGLTKMGAGWKEVCAEIQHGNVLKRNSESVEDAVASWQQLLRYLTIDLGAAIGAPVKIALSRAYAKDAGANFKRDVDELAKDHTLSAEFSIPDTASNLRFSADFLRRTISLSMKLDAPKDKQRATASINWLTRQLKDVEDGELFIRVYWPRRTKITSATLLKALEDPSALLLDGVKDMPSALEIVRVIDLSSKFRGSKTFVEESLRALPKFYGDVGQRLVKWTPKPPKVKATETHCAKTDEEPTTAPTILLGCDHPPS